VAVVEQPPKGGNGVTIHRDSSRTCIHLAVLLVCNAHALYATDQGAITAQDSISIYGNGRVLFVRYAWCGHAEVYYTHSVVVYVCIEATRDDIVLCHGRPLDV
jgi:hypothetical protein